MKSSVRLRCLSFFVFILLFSLHTLQADTPEGGNPVIDSLLNVIEEHPLDSHGAKACIGMAGEMLFNDPAIAESYCKKSLSISRAAGWEQGIGESLGWIAYLLEQRGKADSALLYYEESLALARALRQKKAEATVLNNIAAIYKDKGMITEALAMHEQSIAIKKEIKDVAGLASSYNNVGLIYQNTGQIEPALVYYTLSLHIEDSLGNKEGMASSYQNIASVYKDQGQYPEAMEYLGKSLAINQELHDGYSEAYDHVQIGNIYRAQGKYREAMEEFRISYDLRTRLDDAQGMAYSLKYIGLVHEQQDSLNAARVCYQQSLNLFTGLEDKWGMTSIQNLLGHLHLKLNNTDSAKFYGEHALKNAQELGYPADIRDAAHLLNAVYRVENNWQAALEMNDLYIRMRDSVNNDETRKLAIRNKFQAEFEKKSLLLKAQADQKISEQRLQRNAFIGGFILVLLLVVVLYNRYKIKTAANIELGKKNEIISNEKERSDKLLLNILPLYVANELKESGSAKAMSHESATVMFTDFKDFTKVAEKLSPEELVREINFCFSEFDRIIGNYRIEKVKTIGDAYMCAGGIPLGYQGHPSEVVGAALDIRDFMINLKAGKEAKGESCFQIRIGIATGPVVAGVVGLKKFAYDIWGDTVNVAARMEQNSEAGKVNISGSTYALVQNDFDCEYRGEIEAKNKGKIAMYFAERKS